MTQLIDVMTPERNNFNLDTQSTAFDCFAENRKLSEELKCGLLKAAFLKLHPPVLREVATALARGDRESLQKSRVPHITYRLFSGPDS